MIERKIREYLGAGTDAVGGLDARRRTVTVHNVTGASTLDPNDILEGDIQATGASG